MATVQVLGVLVILGAVFLVAVFVMVRSLLTQFHAQNHRSVPAQEPIDERAMGDLVASAVSGALADSALNQQQQLRGTVETLMDLANDQLGHHVRAGTQSFESQNAVLESRLAAMSGELTRVTDLVGRLQRDRVDQHSQLLGSLEDTARQSQALAETTRTLRQTLTNTRSRGQWGERLADDVLRLAGFVEGVSYAKQRTTVRGTVPDFTFFLNRDLVLHMDVKFPIDNYLRYIEAAGEVEREEYRVRFLKDTKARIKEITGRGYVDPPSTVDHVLLFIPNEAVYGFVLEQDPGLGDYALANRVVLCSPFTLFAVLGVIRQSVEAYRIERTSEEILRVLGGFETQWAKFGDSIDSLGKRLESTSRAFDDLSGPRRRQLQRSMDQVEELRRQRDLGDRATAATSLEPTQATPHESPKPEPERDVVGAEVHPIGASGRIRDRVQRLTG